MKRQEYIISFVFLLALSAWPVVAASQSLSIFFADVGQGDATLLHQPGRCTMLVDAGPEEAGEQLLRVLQEAQVSAIDFAVITHPHQDHFGGLQRIAEEVTIREISDNGDANPKEPGFTVYSELTYEHPYSVLAAGDSWKCGDLNISVLHPAPSYSADGDYNSRSLALMISFNSFRLLLLGDVSGAGEKELLKSQPQLQAMVVQLGHHGAGDGSSRQLLEEVRPRIAIISVGENNALGAPSPQVIRHLENSNVKIFRTDMDGTIKLLVAENGNVRLRP